VEYSQSVTRRHAGDIPTFWYDSAPNGMGSCRSARLIVLIGLPVGMAGDDQGLARLFAAGDPLAFC